MPSFRPSYANLARMVGATLVLAAVLVALAATAAAKQTPVLTKISAGLDDSGHLTVSFRGAGLAPNTDTDYALVSGATSFVTYACIGPSGGSGGRFIPNAATATGAFNSGQDGKVKGASLTLDPPPPNISCTEGQELFLAHVVYQDVVLTDTTNNVSVNVGNFSTCLVPNPNFCQ